MLIGREALEKTNWSRLSHAYGRATDTPQILRGLLTNDVAAHQKVVDHLYGTIIHQDTPWTATAPVALVLAGLLFEESVIHEVNDGDPEKNLLFLRGTLAGFLAATANAAVEAMDELETLKKQAEYNIDHYLDTGAYDQIWEDEDAAMALNARTILACVEAAPVLLDAVCTRLDDPDPRMRVCAAMAATSLCETVPLAHHKERIKARVLSMARSAEDSTERSALVLTLVDYNQADFLTDPAPAVRVCAALADCFREAPNQKWAADITYIRTQEGWLYLAAVIDLFSRKVVGWSMSEHLHAQLVADALRMALQQRRPPPGLLHHSDRGVQYACDDYQQLLAEHQIVCSMSATGNCYDNAVVESFWATLKTELVYHQQYVTRAQARTSIFEYIEVFYNRIRRHSSVGYVSPEVFEAALN